MSVSQTTNLGLFKPQDEDYVDVVADIDDNMDIIDAAIGQPDQGKSLQDEIDDVEANVGNVPSGTTVQGQIDGIKNSIGTVPSGKTVEGQITEINNNIGTVPSGKTVEGQISAIADAIGNTPLPTTAQTLSGAIAEHENDLSEKANKASSVTNGNLLEMDANGNLVNSGKKVADFVLVSNIGTDAEFQAMIDDYYS